MKRLVLLVLALAAFAPATANAAAPCRDRIYNDWYGDGKIATTYPLACYRDALKHVPTDARTYSSLADDIRSAMQGAIARQHGRAVPAQIGKGGSGGIAGKTVRLKSSVKHPTRPRPSSTRTRTTVDPVGQTLPTTSVAAGQTGGGSGLPVPLLVLGGLALLLIAAGTAGAVAKRRRS